MWATSSRTSGSASGQPTRATSMRSPIADHGDVERHPRGQRAEEEQVGDRGPGHVERHRRARDVGHDQVAGRECRAGDGAHGHPPGLAEHGRCRELRPVPQPTGADRPTAPRLAGGVLDDLDAQDRVPGVGGQRRHDRGDLLARVGVVEVTGDRDRHEREQRIGRDRIPLVEPSSQAAGADRQDHVVDRHVVAVLHRLDRPEREASSRPPAGVRSVARRNTGGTRPGGRRPPRAHQVPGGLDQRRGLSQSGHERLAHPLDVARPRAPASRRARRRSGRRGRRRARRPPSRPRPGRSTATRCCLVSSATRPPSRPSSSHASQGGRSRSSGRPSSRPTAASSPARSPGFDPQGPHMVVEVECRVVAPERTVQIERDRDEPAPERRGPMQPAGVPRTAARPGRTSGRRDRARGAGRHDRGRRRRRPRSTSTSTAESRFTPVTCLSSSPSRASPGSPSVTTRVAGIASRSIGSTARSVTMVTTSPLWSPSRIVTSQAIRPPGRSSASTTSTS